MAQDHKDIDQSPPKEFLYLFSIVLFLVNLLSFWNSYVKGGWAQLGLLIIAPIYNGVFLLIGIIVVFRLNKKYPQGNISIFWFTVIFLPILLLLASILLTLTFSHGNGC